NRSRRTLASVHRHHRCACTSERGWPFNRRRRRGVGKEPRRPMSTTEMKTEPTTALAQMLFSTLGMLFSQAAGQMLKRDGFQPGTPEQPKLVTTACMNAAANVTDMMSEPNAVAPNALELLELISAVAEQATLPITAS